MSGPSSRNRYVADNGTNYAVRLPNWERDVADHAATIGQNITAATTESGLPKGYQRRKRYYVITATGKEGSFTVLDPASSIWTAADGHVVEIPLFNSAVTADNATLRGTTGERHKTI
jgi:hypothetical protein